MSMKDTIRRLVGRSVRDLAEEVDEALGRLAHAQGQQAAAQEALRLAEIDVARAEEEVARARDALFEEHPHLRPDTTPRPVIVNHEAKGNFEVVDVDDENDPRFTDDVEISPNDDDPLPDVEWDEHDE